MVGLFFGLRNGYANTACHAFLQMGALVAAGPLTSFGVPRPGPLPAAFDWNSLSTDDLIEIFIFLNAAGEPTTNPPDVPTYEVWGKTAAGVLKIGPYPLSTLGADPRRVSDARAELFFGNAGRAGDVLELEEWALYTDYRLGVRDGLSLPYHAVAIRPDAPLVYRASSGNLPEANVPGRWFPVVDLPNLPPQASSGFSPGQSVVPQVIHIEKLLRGPTGELIPSTGYCAYEREEPLLEDRQSGFMLEAFIAGDPAVLAGDVFGAGFSVDDGTDLYRVAMLQNSVRQSYGLQRKGGAVTDFTGYLESGQDHALPAMTLVRLTIDRGNNQASLRLNDTEAVAVPLDSILLPPSETGQGMVRFGHVLPLTTRGRFSLASLLFVPRYEAYETTGVDLPSDLTPPFALSGPSSGTCELGAQGLLVQKPEFSEPGSQLHYQRSLGASELQGLFLEFSFKVTAYTDAFGTPFAKRTKTGSSLDVFLNTKRLSIGAYDCGVYGRRIAILPGSGTEADILEQTALGQAFSARCDWTEDVVGRLLMRPFDRIELWLGPTTNDPAIVLPWRGVGLGFDLPVDLTLSALRFGHTTADQSSSVLWKYLRWGVGTGYDITLTQDYRDGLTEAHFGGTMSYRLDVEDGA
jgi:hypothetical protein